MKIVKLAIPSNSLILGTNTLKIWSTGSAIADVINIRVDVSAEAGKLRDSIKPDGGLDGLANTDNQLTSNNAASQINVAIIKHMAVDKLLSPSEKAAWRQAAADIANKFNVLVTHAVSLGLPGYEEEGAAKNAYTAIAALTNILITCGVWDYPEATFDLTTLPLGDGTDLTVASENYMKQYTALNAACVDKVGDNSNDTTDVKLIEYPTIVEVDASTLVLSTAIDNGITGLELKRLAQAKVDLDTAEAFKDGVVTVAEARLLAYDYAVLDLGTATANASNPPTEQQQNVIDYAQVVVDTFAELIEIYSDGVITIAERDAIQQKKLAITFAEDRCEDGSTAGATWNENLLLKPEDTQLLNADQLWAEVNVTPTEEVLLYNANTIWNEIKGDLSSGKLEITDIGALRINTRTTGAGLLVGDFDNGNGWEMNNRGLFALALTLPLHAFCTTPSETVAWQQSTVGAVEPVDPGFSITCGDVVLGAYNYRIGGDYLGGLFWDNSAKQLHIRGTIIEESYIDYDYVRNGPARDADKTSANPQDWGWIGGTKPTQDADNTAGVFSTDNLIKTTGDITLNEGADIIMNGTGTNAPQIYFKPTSSSSTWSAITASSGGMGIVPYTSNTGVLYLGHPSFQWNQAYMDLASTGDFSIKFGGTLIAAMNSLGMGVSDSKGLYIGTSYLHTSGSDLYWHSTAGDVKISSSATGVYAPVTHRSTTTTYGIGTSSYYGHVKLSTGTNGIAVGDSDYRLSNDRYPTTHYHSYAPSSHVTDTGVHGGTSASTALRLCTRDSYKRIAVSQIILDVGTFDAYDDLELVEQFKPKLVGGVATLAEEGHQIPDMDSIPTMFKGKVDDAEQDGLNLGPIAMLGIGAIKQLNKEITEDIMESVNSLIEDLMSRIKTLEETVLILSGSSK